MENPLVLSAEESQRQQALETGIAIADCYISRNYLINLDEKNVLAVPEALCKDTQMRLYQVERFVYDKKENVNDKLISVYSALHELGGTAILLVRGSENGVELYLGTRSMSNTALCGDLLSKSVSGNFPGSSIKGKRTSEITSLLDAYTNDNGDEVNNVSAVSVVPSMRDEDKEKFIQGIEKLIDTMQGEVYTALFIASPISKTDLEYRKRGLEEMSSSLSPFMKTTLAYGTNYSKAVSEGMSENFSRSINQSIANTNGYNRSTNTSETFGTNSGFSLLGWSRGKNHSRTTGYSSGSNWSKSVTEGTADTTGTGRTTSDTTTTGDNRTLTVEHINKSVESLVKTIDEQLERIKDCEAFGLWDCAAYFLAPQVQVSVMAANTYKALVAGDSTYVENSYINVWSADNKNRPAVIKSLRYGLHPQIEVTAGSYCGFDSQLVSPGGFISGKELPLFMGIPQKSVSGVSVSEIAQFGRGIYTLDERAQVGDLPLGHIFHMGRREDAAVNLDLNSFTSHCFIAGSTGSGKSNTSYVLLNEFLKRKIPFLVIEPAKGEYKSEFGNVPGIHVYTTNPRYGQMLHINPFWFDHENIHILEHLDRLVEIFNACWEMYAAMPAILKAAAEHVYTEKGWDLLNSIYLRDGAPVFPTFSDLLRVLPEIIKTSSYSADTQGDYTGALVTRVASLANGISGQIFCSSYAIPDSTLFDENTIIDLSRVGSAETKALIMGLLVMKLTEYRTAQATGSNSQLKHITVLEEAHNLLKRTGTSQGQETANLLGKSVEMISNSIAEMRTYGEGFIIIDQSPTAVDIAAIKNTNTKIIMRLPEKADCEAVGNAMALNEDQVKELAKLPTGVAAVMQNNWLETALVKIKRAPSGYQKEIAPVSFDKLRQLRGAAANCVITQYWTDRQFDRNAIRNALDQVGAPVDKVEEIYASVENLIDTVGNGRNVELVVQRLLEITCCRSVFEANAKMLAQADLKSKSAETHRKLTEWQSVVERSLLATANIMESQQSFFTRTMIYAYALAANDENHFLAYETLYESGASRAHEQHKVSQAMAETPKIM